jgi:hypothetical protein
MDIKDITSMIIITTSQGIDIRDIDRVVEV